MKKLINIVLKLTTVIFLFYLLLPNPEFPLPPPDSLQSDEPADTEDPLRRAYFTNFSREEVMSWYGAQFDHSDFRGLKVPTYRLNYGPEESQTIIRDQTRSTFLEEIVHPFRESVYINGFEPKNAKDAIFIDGRPWRQKIIVKYVPSPPWVRVLVFSGIVAMSLIVFGAIGKEVGDVKKVRTQI